jgi:thiazole synthase
MQVYGTMVKTPLFLGTARYPSPAILLASIKAAGAEVITVSLRREGTGGGAFRDLLAQSGARVLPNTAGCHSAAEAITTARMAREVFETDWLKLEVIGDADSLQPDVFQTVQAAKVLCAEGFKVFPYTTDDLIVGERLLDAGCQVLMPWGAPIGTCQGLRNPDALRAMRAHFQGVPLIVDAGIGAPSHAAAVMEMGFDGVLANTAVALAADPEAMAGAMAGAVLAGRAAHRAGIVAPRDMAEPSTPVLGLAVLG